MAILGEKYLAGNLCKTFLTHDAVDEDEYQVEKDDESKSSQEDNTIHRVDLHSGLFSQDLKDIDNIFSYELASSYLIF